MTKLVMIVVFVCVFVLDQLTKFIAKEALILGQPVPVIPDIFDLTLVYNPGAAFGMFTNWDDTTRRITLAVVSIIALLVVIRFMVKEAKHDKWSQFALSGILAGAFGNIIDRFRYDAVIDFLDFYWGEYHWPAFNVADSAICIGVFSLIIRMMFVKREE